MKLRIGLALLALAGIATADDKPTKRKAPDKYTKAAGEAFAAAVAADEAGDQDKAIGLYKKAWKISPHANTAYNLGDVAQRDGDLRDAMFWFEAYLALAPKASDRDAVTKTIAALAATPAILYIPEKGVDSRSSNEALEIANAYIFVDGTLVSKPGNQPQTRSGHSWPGIWVEVSGLEEHVIDAVSSISYGEGMHTRCSPPPGRETVCSPTMPDIVPGNVVIGGHDAELRVRIEGKDGHLVGRRIELPPGKHTIGITDRSYECTPLTIDVPADDSVRYVHIRTEGDRLVPHCRPLKISQQLLTF